MIKRCAFLLLATACADLEVDSITEEVLDGTQQPDAYFPWRVRLGSGCQGALVAPGWVMTAAHCMPGQGVITHERTHPITGDVHVQERTWFINENVGYFIPDDYVFCNGFCTNEHDVALIRTNAPFEINELTAPAHLPFRSPEVGTMLTMASRFHNQPQVPGYLSVYQAPVTAIGPDALGHFAGGFEITDPDSGACKGDSGSGLISNDGGRITATGVASQANTADDPNCALPGQNILVMDVARHLDWVLDVFRSQRMPNTTLATAPAVCRTAPQRHGLGESRRRADVAEIWAHGYTNPKASFAIHPSGGDMFGVFEEWAHYEGGINPSNIRWSAGDFDGDGDQDLVAAWNDAGSTTLTLRRSTGASFTTHNWRARWGAWTGTSVWLPGDFDGDGRTDLVEVKQDGAYTSFLLWRSTGSSFAAPTAPFRQGGWNSATKWNVADFNADGRDDILATWQEGTGTTFTVRTSIGNGTFGVNHWLPQSGGWANNMQFLVGNFDASGGPDVMVAWNDGGKSTLTFYRNQGASFAPGIPWATKNGGWHDSVRWRAGDFDADGRDEVLAVWNDGGMATFTMRRWVSNGESGLRVEHWANRRVVWQPSTDWCVGTFDNQ